MIHDLKPYPAYKDSGVPWLGKVPEHWKQLPGRACFTEKKIPNIGLQEKTVLSLSYGQIVVKPPEKLHGLVPASFETYQIIEPNDIIIRSTDLQNDRNSLRFGFAKTRGIITSAYICFQPTELLIPEYGHLLLHTYDLMKIFYGLGSGLRQNLDWRDFKYLPCPVPPLLEQSTIVHYLDYIDRRIRRYVRTKQKLIKLLEEQKQAIIHQAVTRGLDPNVNLKPSGVEWLGDVPEHWEVVALRRVTLERCDGPFGSGLKSSHYTEHGIRVVRLTNIGHAEFRNSNAAFISPMHYASLGDHSVKAGDVLIAGLGDERHPAGRACVAPAEILPAMVKADCFRFRLKENRINPKFAALQLTATAVAASAILSTGATRQRTNLQSTTGRMITIPPLLEQEAVLDYISENTSTLNITIDRAHRGISLLREYRIRLIADVVTGKLDVREAATNLPEETEVMETFDDSLAEDGLENGEIEGEQAGEIEDEVLV